MAEDLLCQSSQSKKAKPCINDLPTVAGIFQFLCICLCLRQSVTFVINGAGLKV